MFFLTIILFFEESRILAPFFSQEKLLEIRSRADIIEIISEYVTLKRVGKNYVGLCPFHSEKTPSFNVNEEKQAFYCFGCQKGGDVITFLREIQNISFMDAVSQLAERYGIVLSSSGDKQERKDRQKLIEINSKVANYFHKILIEKPEGELGRRYLKKRNISPEVWEIFKLGYAPDRWDGLVKYLSSENIPLELAKETGLISSKKRGGFFDCFRGRIIFPIFNLNGKVIGFGGRTITGGEPKYLNSSDSVIYQKRFSLFGLPMVRSSIRHEDRVFIVEGYFDLLRMYQSGVFPTVASLGTALTRGHIQTLKRFTPNFYVVFDADDAGIKAAFRSLELFLDEGISPRVILLPAGADPDEFILKEGVKNFQRKIESAPFLIEYFLNKTIQEEDISIPERKVEVIKKIMPVIDRIVHPLVKDEYIRKVAEKLEVREEHIRTFNKARSPSAQKGLLSPINERRPEEFLLSLMIHKPETIQFVDKARVIDDFNSDFLKEIGELIIRTFRAEGKLDLNDLVDKLEEEQKNFVIKLGFRKEDFGNFFDSLKDCVYTIKRNKIKKMKISLTQKIKEAQESQDEIEVRNLNQRKNELIHQEKNLYNNLMSLLTPEI